MPANPATYATLSLTDGHGNPFPLSSPITVALSSNDPADLTVPSTVMRPGRDHLGARFRSRSSTIRTITTPW